MSKKKRETSVKVASIGGQAVMEGVMMRGTASMATAVRTCDGGITIEAKRIKAAKEKSFWHKVPVVRGVLNFGAAMYSGVGTLARSAEALGEEAEPTKLEIWLAKKTKIDLMSLVIGFAVILGMLFAVGLFVVLPELIAKLLFEVLNLWGGDNVLIRNFCTGLVRIAIFVLYIVACSRMQEINRLFRYHGAEHKTINAYEHGDELTVENVRKHTTVHKRCGTTFMFLVMVISILVFSALYFLPGYDNTLYKILYKILFLPLVAGISYEVLKLLALSDNILFRAIRAPGMWLQKLTTKEPDDKMLEVAIAAFTTVMEMDADPSVPERDFDLCKPYKAALKEVRSLLPAEKFESADIDWIFCEVLGVARGELNTVKTVSGSQYERAMELAKERTSGKPLQYVLGYTEFYGYRIKTDARALIPRPETELLAEKVIEAAEGKAVLDLCTGSGAIAIAVAKEGGAKVTASDLSAAAVELAAENAKLCGAEIEFKISDMFESLTGRFDIIVCNPPYIPTGDIDGLQSEVKDYEPVESLDGGADGLNFYRIIAKEAKDFLNEGGTLMLEFGIGQKAALEEIFSNFALTFYDDYSGIPRILIAR